MRVAQLAKPPEKARRHRNEPRLALDRLDDHRRDRGRIDLGDESVLELPDAEIDILFFSHAVRRAKQLRYRKPDDLGREGAEPALEQPVLAGKAQREQRAAVIAALETHNHRTPGELPRQLHGVLDGFGAAVGEDRLLPERAWRHLVQDLHEPHVRLVGGDQGADVDEFLGLPGDRLDDRRG